MIITKTTEELQTSHSHSYKENCRRVTDENRRVTDEYRRVTDELQTTTYE